MFEQPSAQMSRSLVRKGATTVGAIGEEFKIKLFRGLCYRNDLLLSPRKDLRTCASYMEVKMSLQQLFLLESFFYN